MTSDPPLYIVNVEGAIAKGDEYLVARRSSEEEHAAGVLGLVGGKVETSTEADTGDVLKETVRREIHEETTLEVADEMAYVESWSFSTDNGMPVVNTLFLCQYDGGTAISAEPDEIESIHWMTADEVANHSDVPSWTHQSVEQAEDRRVELNW
jgi:8-oxo-dGTP diphosphatase